MIRRWPRRVPRTTDMLGNLDGEALEDPNRSGRRGINYYPPRGDNQEVSDLPAPPPAFSLVYLKGEELITHLGREYYD